MQPREPKEPVSWGPTANPNTPEGEIQGVSAFSSGLANLTGWRRATARIVVWVVLIAIAIALVVGLILQLT